MRKMGIGVLVALGLVMGLMFAASELGGEVVTLVTSDTDGTLHETSLWIVEDEGALWLRAGNPDSSWLKRIRKTPAVTLTRAGKTVRYRAEVVLGRNGRINQLMADGYGWADRVIGGMRDAAETVAIRLVPAGS